MTANDFETGKWAMGSCHFGKVDTAAFVSPRPASMKTGRGIDGCAMASDRG